MKKLFMLVLFSFILTGCATTEAQKQQEAANAPLVEAGLITPKMAKYMVTDDADKIQQLIDTSQPQMDQSWKNKVTHDAYQFTSLGIDVNSAGQPCRTYQIKALISGSNQQLQTTACRQADGTWQAKMDSTPQT
jgi:surface antigen